MGCRLLLVTGGTDPSGMSDVIGAPVCENDDRQISKVTKIELGEVVEKIHPERKTEHVPDEKRHARSKDRGRDNEPQISQDRARQNVQSTYWQMFRNKDIYCERSRQDEDVMKIFTVKHIWKHGSIC